MEGRFWHVRWERTRSGYRAWLADRPKIKAAGGTWEETVDAIMERIGYFGDGEPIMSFDPPEPMEGDDAAHAHPDWLMIGAEGYVNVASDQPELFTGGFCEHCRQPIGERTDVPLIAKGPGHGDFCWPEFFTVAFKAVMCSRRLIDALTPDERSRFRWIPVTPAPRTRNHYTECVPARFLAPVAVRGWTISGAECPVCGFRDVTCTSYPEIDYSEKQIHTWVAGEDLGGEPLIAIGTCGNWLPIFPAARARELARAFRGLSVSRIGRAPPDRVLRKPQLPVYTKQR